MAEKRSCYQNVDILGAEVILVLEKTAKTASRPMVIRQPAAPYPSMAPVAPSVETSTHKIQLLLKTIIN